MSTALKTNLLALVCGALALTSCSPPNDASTLAFVDSGEVGYLQENCRGSKGPVRLNQIATGQFQIFSFLPDPCGRKRSFSLDGPPGFKGIVAVDGYYAADNSDIRNDTLAAVNAYQKAGWKVVNTSNRNPEQIEALMTEQRRENPNLFDGSKPFHYLGISHGGNAGADGTTFHANDGDQQYTAFAADRAAASIRGAGNQVGADLIFSACHSGAMINCQRDSLNEVSGQINSVSTSSTANQLSFGNSQQREQFLDQTLSALEYNPAQDTNRDGKIEMSEVAGRSYNHNTYTVNSAYVNNDWIHSAANPSYDGQRVVDEKPGTVTLEDQQFHTFSRTWELPQTPQTSGNSPVLSVAPQVINDAPGPVDSNASADPFSE